MPSLMIAAMDGRLPLSALLSHVLVAFTIELDNEFEHHMTHRTTDHGSTAGARQGPWLVSLAMWGNCMQFIPEEGITVREFGLLARSIHKDAGILLTRMGKWWGYVAVEPDTPESIKRPRPDAVVRPTLAGRRAQEIWLQLFGVIEARWQERFGKGEIGRLRESLGEAAGHLDADLPDCLPILGYGLFSRRPQYERHAPAKGNAASTTRSLGRAITAYDDLPLSALLSRVLLAFAIEFERESEVSLAISANVLRLAAEQGVRVRDLPRMAAVSKESIAVSLSFLEKRGYAVVKPEAPGSRVKMLVLPPKGQRAGKVYGELVRAIEERWCACFGKGTIGRLRGALEKLVGAPNSQSPLLRGLEPYPDGWRASVPRPDGLPHYPMVLHRGGFPDGS